ncbi:ABC transporter permease [Lacticaseibacillus brantae]|uniref:ABC superfamily ATP binding cassette transporter, membrane protein n=1 Tax=Lacticaseibacillus brantae DSM 23927 TaxID=1423727 RepID=A0A0R2AXR5_9LACO|nr:ABC transporter permease [Lacticaseibacillus brantae]KRM72177.1 ABC superfamily ATP binding cassette transporter, membrane protein [Lacticaseibacillus brantae DSM 23927]
MLITSITLGLLWTVMAIGVYLTFRILDIADMTAEGSLPLGGALTAHALTSGVSPVLATLYGFLGGLIAGLVSGLLKNKLDIPDLLTGILTMTGLYSVNLFIMGKANIPLVGDIKTVYSVIPDPTTSALVINGGLVLIVIVLLIFFFNTEMGLAARAVGNNPAMSAANGVKPANMQILVYMISNGLIALSGSLMAQMNGFADISMGIGTIVIALAAIIIAEILFRHLTFGMRLVTIIIGAIIYRLIIAFVLDLGVDPNSLRLFYAGMLALFLALPKIQRQIRLKQQQRQNKRSFGGDAK